ncbi:MAG: bifunctional phosphoglucose/phosphomannose isomerase [Candidatus Aenigmarchaeota archaeon]|nr:bifunctional phosphoglucose/phosphomannose isomerase [Candidatus Aenigmarchaeota archaeon]
MYETIKGFNNQFSFMPRIENEKNLEKRRKFIVAGMGGSHLSAGLLKIWNPSLDVIIHQDYGLPAMEADELEERLVIAISYSGNTEEVVDAFEKAVEKKIPVAVISTGGRLLEMAKKHSVPYVRMPDTGIQPRCALGLSMKSMLKIMGEEKALKEMESLVSMNPGDYEKDGRDLAGSLKGRVPVIYSSARNYAIAYNWKTKFNETGKIPAFFNVFPELNHNEMTGFDSNDKTMPLSEKFHFVFLKDTEDNPKIQKRMEVLKALYNERKLGVEIAEIKGKSVFHRIFSSLLTADWAAYYTSQIYGTEPEKVPMVEEFKNLIR